MPAATSRSMLSRCTLLDRTSVASTVPVERRESPDLVARVELVGLVDQPGDEAGHGVAPHGQRGPVAVVGQAARGRPW
jgi:hypothetical protein